MAITRAQQYRQMLKDGKVAMQGGVKNYLGKKKTVTVPKDWQSSPDHPTTELAYITKAEKDLLIKKDLHNSLNGKPNRGPEGVMSLNGWGDKGDTSDRSFGGGENYGGSTTTGGSGTGGGGSNIDTSGRKDTGTGNYQVTDQKAQDEYEKNRKKREAEAKQKAIEEKFKADAKATRKEMRNKVLADKKTRQQRINDILSGKFGVDNPYGLSPTELADLNSLGIDPNQQGPMTDMQQDIFDQMMEKNDRFSGVNLENFQNKFDLPTTGITSLDLVTSLLEGPLSKGAKRTKEFFTDDVLGSRKYKYDGNVVNPEIFSMLNPTEMQEIYGDYDTRRMSGEIDAYGNPNPDFGINDDGPDQVMDPCKGPNPPAYCFVDDKKEEDEVNPRDYTGLAPRFLGSSFDFTGLADGGRAGYQQGGSIMPRLNDLGTDVSSAEQMLQEINQRLQSAESTLGEGGGDPSSGLIAIQPNNFNNFQPRQMPIGQPNNQFNVTLPETLKPASLASDVFTSAGVTGGPQVSDLSQPLFDKDGFRLGDQRYGTGLVGGPQMALTGLTNQTPGGPMQSPLAGAIRQGAMDGGRMRQMEMMEDEDDPTGGIMDLESGRQMYFLGKLVKKATRAVKKVAKSPLGKAALMYGLGSLGAGFLGKAQAGTGTGFFSGLKGKLFGTAAGKGYSMPGRGIFNKATEGLLGKLGITKGSGSMMPTLGGGINLGLGLPFALDALGVGKDEDKGTDLDEYYKTQGIDIDAIRNNPNRILARRFMAEGGDAEPVAKKTMPLLDMDGQEMDLRAEGGFVPIGRMERADDVPARLSKNEFVFTADAVRNAGEGDIDKGAEVMYNMMKNLESGGEVSEESQGLDGAREMFKTSQRLEEVL